MNRHLHSPTQLTEFAREFEELPDTMFGKFVNRLTNVYNNSYNSVNEVQPGKILVQQPSGAAGSEVPQIVTLDGQRRTIENVDESPFEGTIASRPLSSPVAENDRSSMISEHVLTDEASSSSNDKVILKIY